MKTPIESGYEWISLSETPSTQTVAAESVRAGQRVGVVFALDQTAGRGRFGRTWVSSPGESLTYSLIFHSYADHARPHLIGMAVAIAAAGTLHCQLRWPNDLVIGGLKVGGILTEIILDETGRRIPVVGVGLNLNQTGFPSEIQEIATSMRLARGTDLDAETVGRAILKRLSSLPEPTSWDSLAPIWNLFDATPGKTFRLPTEEIAVALGIGSEGQLMCAVNGESRSVLAAEAIFGFDG